MYRTILVPVDGSAAASSGLEEAMRLASAIGARLHLMNIVDDMMFSGDGDRGATAAGELRSVVREGGEKVLRRARAHAEESGVIASTSLVRSGSDGWQALVARQAEECGADLIVLGTHGSRSVSRLFMSPEAGHLLNVVTVPVLLVRSKGDDSDVSVNEISASDSMFQATP